MGDVVYPRVRAHLTRLKLPRMAESLDPIAQEATKHDWTYRAPEIASQKPLAIACQWHDHTLRWCLAAIQVFGQTRPELALSAAKG